MKSWDADTITEQIAALGGWEVSLGVLLIDKNNNEWTHRPGEVSWPLDRPPHRARTRL